MSSRRKQPPATDPAEGLFEHNAGGHHAQGEPPGRPSQTEDHPRASRVRASALWSAYGDALGFISELTDEAGLRRRTGGRELRAPMAWRRRIGGRSGVTVLLPEGCYSDDTQLRMATSRAIGPAEFDVEAFAKVELPVWLGYTLGGGRATKAAATNMATSKAPWFANAYDGWIHAGGNGGAMRIQPHVWAASTGAPPRYLLDVLRNTVTTHGHPRALMGAVLHALSLAQTLDTGELPTASVLTGLLEATSVVPSLVREDPELGDLWLGLWERTTSARFDDAWEKTKAEASQAILAAEQTVGGPAERYHQVLRQLGLFDEASRGNGILSAVAAVALGWCEPNPREAMVVAANAIGSDTDTIATLAGAILGASAGAPGPANVMDATLVVSEADRMTAIADGAEVRGHQYPDLLEWSPPRTHADALVAADQGLWVLGLGPARALGDPLVAAQSQFAWQWVQLEFGQTLLMKRRLELRTIHHPQLQSGQDDGREGDRTDCSSAVSSAPPATATDQRLLESSSEPRDAAFQRADDRARYPVDRGVDLDRVLGWLETQRYNDAAVGYALRRVARDGTVEQLVALTSTLRTRLRR